VSDPRATIRARVPVRLGRAQGARAELITFDGLHDGREHLACLVARTQPKVPLVRIHSECLTGDVFASTRCDCGAQLDEALHHVAMSGAMLLYLRQEGRGIGLYNKLDAYLIQSEGFDTYTANRMVGKAPDERDYGVAVAMLDALGYRRIRLLTNNPDKVRQLKQGGIVIDEVVGTTVQVTDENVRYLRSKADLAGHTLDLCRGHRMGAGDGRA
jgi:GTP cyclohydrolase II